MVLNTPCYIFDKKLFEKNVEDFYREFNNFFSDFIIAYSFKTNSLPAVLATALNAGCYAEVVSDVEYDLAGKVGFSDDKIVFNGPIKADSCLEDALGRGAIVNIDSQAELNVLSNRDGQREDHVGLRVNFDLEACLPGQTLMGDEGGRFGYSYENGDLHRAIEICRINNVSIDGLHMHVSSKTKSVEVYSVLAEMAVKIAKEEELDIKYIDIGGGFFGGNDDGKAYKEYAEVIYEALKPLGNIRLIAEPGASLVATAFSYQVTVKETKHTNRACFVVTDGTRLHTDPFFKRNRYEYSVIPDDYGREREMFHKQVICGYTCMENDRFMSVNDSMECFPGDRIEFKTVGSYSLCFNPLFIRYLPNVYLKEGDKYTLVREEWSVGDYLHKCKW